LDCTFQVTALWRNALFTGRR